ncbi:MAG TPA: FAD-dependent oxidoreductase, partial [Anaerolineales bacterium]
LKENGGIKMHAKRIEEIRTGNDSLFQAAIFIDASYEGDLMAQSGVSYTWGREGMDRYHESLAGVRPKDPNHQFDFPVSAFDEARNLLPEIQLGARGELGAGDQKIQAYNFRMILTQERDNRVPFPRPSDYRAERYELLRRFLSEFSRKEGRPPRLDEILLPREIANGKWDFNNRGPFSTDYIGGSWDYPNASYQRRREIWRDHIDYTQGVFYFLAHDPGVPKPLQEALNEFGLAKDEFVEHEHWPHQLYVRESRRMVGDFVITQKDIQTQLTKADVIGMGSYNSDSHNVQRYVTEQGHAQNEGNMEVPVTPYQIPFRMMLPRKTQVTNLLVTVCFSASHVTYSTLRMEPVYMIIGQAAGVAASMAIAAKAPLYEIDTTALTAILRSQGAIIE